MPTHNINHVNLAYGASTAQFANDRGYSPIDKGFNVHYKKGLLAPPPAMTKKADVDDEVVALANSEGSLGTSLCSVNKDGQIHSYATDGTPTLEIADSTNSYTPGKCDMVYYNGNYYATHNSGVIKFSTSFSSPDYTFKVGLNSFTPHQLLVFDDKLYVTNADEILIYDGSTWETFNVEEQYKISAFAVVEGNIWITADPYYNTAGYFHGDSTLIEWDGSNPNPNYYYPLSDRVDSIVVLNGKVWMFTKRYAGVWNGLNIDSKIDLHSQVFKHQITTYRNDIFFKYSDNGGYTSTFNNVKPTSYSVCSINNKTYAISFPFQYVPDPADASQHPREIDALICFRDDKFIFCSIDKILYSELSDISGSGYYRDRTLYLDKNVKLEKLFVELEDEIEGEIVFTYIDHNGVEQALDSIKTRLSKEIDLTGRVNDTRSFTLRIYFKTNGKPIKRLGIDYSITEQSTR